ncbi:hypothetical protein A3L04_06410 [Thermococcus chitonophagus]|uniref:Uncharacterized protein n=1 Tax=Thermococcus chitonophagus TaxID=54262 RepID=A0A160VUC0_9EURY|nr:hypothetical protein [Thermococcus chitonophagus]ASJ16730.1 hypothetical protein A3L04_06410 [Thermococcus chitonophagus]CUX78196.1 hypothetical protein CHITON_1417 [Thermococcus chitonophagus]
MSEAVNAKDLFKAIMENYPQDSAPSEVTQEEPVEKVEDVKVPSDIKVELMRLAMLKLKYIAQNTFQPEIREAAIDAAKYLRIIIETDPEFSKLKMKKD